MSEANKEISSLEEFLVKFEELAPKTKWHLDCGIRLRSKKKHWPECPVCFVANETEKFKKEEYHVLFSLTKLAKHDYVLASKIAAAADNDLSMIEKYEGFSKEEFTAIRNRMLKACGLANRDSKSYAESVWASYLTSEFRVL